MPVYDYVVSIFNRYKYLKIDYKKEPKPEDFHLAEEYAVAKSLYVKKQANTFGIGHIGRVFDGFGITSPLTSLVLDKQKEWEARYLEIIKNIKEHELDENMLREDSESAKKLKILYEEIYRYGCDIFLNTNGELKEEIYQALDLEELAQAVDEDKKSQFSDRRVLGKYLVRSFYVHPLSDFLTKTHEKIFSKGNIFDPMNPRNIPPGFRDDHRMQRNGSAALKYMQDLNNISKPESIVQQDVIFNKWKLNKRDALKRIQKQILDEVTKLNKIITDLEKNKAKNISAILAKKDELRKLSEIRFELDQYRKGVTSGHVLLDKIKEAEASLNTKKSRIRSFFGLTYTSDSSRLIGSLRMHLEKIDPNLMNIGKQTSKKKLAEKIVRAKKNLEETKIDEKKDITKTSSALKETLFSPLLDRKEPLIEKETLLHWVSEFKEIMNRARASEFQKPLSRSQSTLVLRPGTNTPRQLESLYREMIQYLCKELFQITENGIVIRPDLYHALNLKEKNIGMNGRLPFQKSGYDVHMLSDLIQIAFNEILYKDFYSELGTTSDQAEKWDACARYLQILNTQFGETKDRYRTEIVSTWINDQLSSNKQFLQNLVKDLENTYKKINTGSCDKEYLEKIKDLLTQCLKGKAKIASVIPKMQQIRSDMSLLSPKAQPETIQVVSKVIEQLKERLADIAIENIDTSVSQMQNESAEQKLSMRR